MSNYCAQLENNIVIEIVVGEYLWVTENLPGQWYDLGGDPLTVGVGYIYNPQTDTFAPPYEANV